ncbi:GAT domain-containing protein [Rutstroemia sp. NJR-2017a WRK4]|nr:GAT domain-containing protein [Rutstroemia sp. NJR-2017a WRK4]
MKAMKNMGMNRMLGSLKRSKSSDDHADPQLDTPEANAAKNTRLFCESGAPNGGGEEVLYLPSIVEAAESSPAAAKECAYLIRKYLSKENYTKPAVQYNALMLLRILTDNPGKTFTRNMDTKFVQTVKELLRFGMDLNVKQLLIETLQSFSREKTEDETLAPLLEMWKKYQEKMVKAVGPVAPRTLNAPPFNPDSQNYFGRNHHTRRLPPPAELSSRIEEARTSAKLLSQVVQSTPPSEILSHELIREFADRCQSASRSVQAYMVSENPAPDNDTMETLIETNEQLSNAMNQHQRAVLQARKILGLGYKDRNSATSPSRTDSGFAAPPPGPPPGRTDSGFAAPPPGPPPNQTAKPQQPARRSAPPIPPPGDIAPIDDDEDDSPNPFSDPKTTTRSPPFLSDAPSNAPDQFNDTLGVEPYHPGFRESKSYVGRQDSAVGNVTMHAAVPEEDSDDERNYRGPTPTPAQPKQPVYRY